MTHRRRTVSAVTGLLTTVLTVLVAVPAGAAELPPGTGGGDPPADEVYSVSMTATPRVRGTGLTTISGTYMPGTGVDIYARPSGATGYSFLGSLETDDVGAYTGTFAIKKTTLFQARSAGLASPVGRTLVYSAVTLTARSKSKGRATLSALGDPNVEGRLTFYRSVVGKDPVLSSMTSNVNGNGYPTVRLPKGTRWVYVIFKAPGTGEGISEKVKVTVK